VIFPSAFIVGWAACIAFPNRQIIFVSKLLSQPWLWLNPEATSYHPQGFSLYPKVHWQSLPPFSDLTPHFFIVQLIFCSQCFKISFVSWLGQDLHYTLKLLIAAFSFMIIRLICGTKGQRYLSPFRSIFLMW
jgi:hypothetical protein